MHVQGLVAGGSRASLQNGKEASMVGEEREGMGGVRSEMEMGRWSRLGLGQAGPCSAATNT